MADRLKRVTDDAGRVYAPGRGVKQFDEWDPARTYTVQVSHAVTLVVTGTPLGDGSPPSGPPPRRTRRGRDPPSGPVTVEVPLEPGSNAVTLAVDPEDRRIEAVVASVADRLKRVTDDAGRVYAPGRGVKQFDEWDPARTYTVQVSHAVTLVVTGTPLGQTASVIGATANLAVPAPTFELRPNYPNPFGGTTTIGYGIPITAHVTLEVYNLVGQRVATLVDGVRPAGTHEVPFDGSALAAGVYVYRLTAGTEQSVRRMAVVR